ncbi:MAG: hypothetical protein ABIG32_02635 [Candidatus Uhrbacteria bacterium]|nr:hypothetical protein [Patescibacteria group bacterium]MBU1907031.1 hypothetical protein [Patescibacteria group bacterium]
MKASEIISQLLDDYAPHFVHTDPNVCAAVAQTNTSGMDYDVHEVLWVDADFVTREIDFTAVINMCGDQLPDHVHEGDRLVITVTGLATNDGVCWSIARCDTTHISNNVEEEYAADREGEL